MYLKAFNSPVSGVNLVTCYRCSRANRCLPFFSRQLFVATMFMSRMGAACRRILRMSTRVANNFQLLAKTVRSTLPPRCSLLFFVALLTVFRSRTRRLSIGGRRASFLWPPYRTLWTSRGRRGTSVGWYRLTSTHSSISLNLALASHMYILHQINTWKVPAENVR